MNGKLELAWQKALLNQTKKEKEKLEKKYDEKLDEMSDLEKTEFVIWITARLVERGFDKKETIKMLVEKYNELDKL